MKCDRVRDALDALCDGELGRWAAFRMERHVKRCSACAEIYAETLKITESARAWRDFPVSEAWLGRLDEAARNLPADSSPTLAPDLSSEQGWQRPGERRTMKRLSMALATVAVAGGLVWMGLRPSPAYARLLRISHAFMNLKSAHFVGWRQGANNEKIPLEIWFSQPNSSWQKEGDRREVCDGEHVWRFREGGRSAVRQPFTSKDRAAAWRRLFTLDAQLQWVKSDPDRLLDLGTQRAGGETLRVLRVDGPDLDVRTTWWVDPDTDLIRKFVQEQSTGPSGNEWRVKAASERIEYDVTSPGGMFASPVPPGMKVLDLPPGRPGSFANRLSRGEVTASMPNRVRDHYNPEGTGMIDLLAFTRSNSGLIFAVLNGDEWSGLPESDPQLALIDGKGRKTVGRLFDSAGTPETGHTYLFIPHVSEAGAEPGGFKLVYSRPSGSEGGKPEIVAAFEGLRLAPPPPALDEMADDFAYDEMHTSLEYLRSAELGLAAFHEGRRKEAESYLRSAVSQARFGFNDRTDEVHLALADLYLQAQRAGDAQDVLNRLYAHSDGKSHEVVLNAAGRMAKAGDRGTALRWLEAILKVGRGKYPAVPGEMTRAVNTYVALGGSREVAVEGLERSMRDSHAPGVDSLGSVDAWKLGSTFEAMGRKDLALEAYTRGLETSGLMNPAADEQERERMTAAVRRLGGEGAVRRLKDRSG